MSDYPGAVDIRTSHFWTGSQGQPRRWIVLHGTAGFTTAQEVADYFKTNSPPTSTHYVIGKDGAIVQCVGEGDSAWGNGVLSAGHDPWWTPATNPNLQTFSIEHVKFANDNSDTLTPAQAASSFALVAHLCRAHGIPPRAGDASGGIVGHNSIDPVNRSRCPGPYPWAALFAYLASGGVGMGVPAGWQDNGGELTAPNGHTVDLGFRDTIIAAPNWPAALQPMGPRTYDGQGNATQSFSLNLYWDKANNQISELAGPPDLSSRLAALEAQIAELEQQLQSAGGSGSVEAVAAVSHLVAAAKAMGLTL